MMMMMMMKMVMMMMTGFKNWYPFEITNPDRHISAPIVHSKVTVGNRITAPSIFSTQKECANLQVVFTCLGDYNEVPHTGGHINVRNLLLTVLEVGKSKNQCPVRAHFLLHSCLLAVSTWKKGQGAFWDLSFSFS